MIRYWGTGSLTLQQEAQGPYEAHTLKLDSSKARARLGWRPALSLDEALKLCVHWYRGHLEDPGSAPQITAEQIRRYAAATGT